MAAIGDRVLDAGLSSLDTEANRLDICSTQPATYGEATTGGTYSLGNKTGISIGAPADRGGGGREVTVSAISDGSVTNSGTANYWAITDTGNSRLLATGSITSPQSVTAGNTFSLASFTIGIPDPA